MYTDLLGKRRLKVGLHIHTTRSDGHKTPEEALDIYQALGYDAIAITDHWVYTPADMNRTGTQLLSGCEYNVGGNQAQNGVYHIVGVGMTEEPDLDPTAVLRPEIPSHEQARAVIRGIRAAGGMAIFAHPAWSLNTPAQILAVGDTDALEIYNSVSDWGMSDRPYSGLLVDMVAAVGYQPPLIATDDTHYYTGEEGRGFIMVDADAVEAAGGGMPGIIRAVKNGDFYATQGPELHVIRTGEKNFKVICSPCQKIAFLSNVVWTKGRIHRGDGLTEATYTVAPGETFVRVEITDKNGLAAWSAIYPLHDRVSCKSY